MIRPPPSSTRTDTLFPYTNALPISFVHSGRHPGQASARLLYLGEREPGSRANVRALALDPRLKAEGDDESWWRHWCDHRQRCVNSVARQEGAERSEEHTSELQSLMRISYAVFCLNKKT